MADLIPPGTYRAKASSSTFGTTKNGNEVLEVNFAITEPGDFEGWMVRWSGFFSEKTEARTRESLDYMGFRPASQAEWIAICDTYQDASHLFPNEVKIVVTHENGYAKVEWVNSLFGKGIKANEHPLDKQAAKNFAARMAAGSKPAPAATPRTPGSGPGGSTPTAHNSSKGAREARTTAPNGSGEQEPPSWLDDGPTPDF
jgi:hypothetical protein